MGKEEGQQEEEINAPRQQEKSMIPGCFFGHDLIQHHWCNGFFYIFWERRMWVRQQACLQGRLLQQLFLCIYLQKVFLFKKKKKGEE